MISPCPLDFYIRWQNKNFSVPTPVFPMGLGLHWSVTVFFAPSSRALCRHWKEAHAGSLSRTWEPSLSSSHTGIQAADLFWSSIYTPSMVPGQLGSAGPLLSSGAHRHRKATIVDHFLPDTLPLSVIQLSRLRTIRSYFSPEVSFYPQVLILTGQFSKSYRQTSRTKLAETSYNATSTLPLVSKVCKALEKWLLEWDNFLGSSLKWIIHFLHSRSHGFPLTLTSTYLASM